jgi:hypothetical protein
MKRVNEFPNSFEVNLTRWVTIRLFVSFGNSQMLALADCCEICRVSSRSHRANPLPSRWPNCEWWMIGWPLAFIHFLTNRRSLLTQWSTRLKNKSFRSLADLPNRLVFHLGMIASMKHMHRKSTLNRQKKMIPQKSHWQMLFLSPFPLGYRTTPNTICHDCFALGNLFRSQTRADIPRCIHIEAFETAFSPSRSPIALVTACLCVRQLWEWKNHPSPASCSFQDRGVHSDALRRRCCRADVLRINLG